MEALRLIFLSAGRVVPVLELFNYRKDALFFIFYDSKFFYLVSGSVLMPKASPVFVDAPPPICNGLVLPTLALDSIRVAFETRSFDFLTNVLRAVDVLEALPVERHKVSATCMSL